MKRKVFWENESTDRRDARRKIRRVIIDRYILDKGNLSDREKLEKGFQSFPEYTKCRDGHYGYIEQFIEAIKKWTVDEVKKIEERRLEFEHENTKWMYEYVLGFLGFIVSLYVIKELMPELLSWCIVSRLLIFVIIGLLSVLLFLRFRQYRIDSINSLEESMYAFYYDKDGGEEQSKDG